MRHSTDPQATQRVTYRRSEPTTLEVGDGYELEPCTNCNTTGRVAPELGAELVTCQVCHGARHVPVPVRSTQREVR